MRQFHCAVLMLPLLATAGACSRTPTTDAERLAHGRELVDAMSRALGGAKAFSVTTREVRDRQPAKNPIDHRSVTRSTIVRRPDRLHFKTEGDARNEGWYDGVGLTLAMHGQKVFAQARMPETLDRTLDAISERYAIWMPLSDRLHVGARRRRRLQPVRADYYQRVSSGYRVVVF